MIKQNYPTNGSNYEDIRSWEELKWADDIYHTPSKIPFFIRPLWYLKTYMTICSNGAPHDIEFLNQKWKMMGFFDAIDCTIMELRNRAYSAKYRKESFIREKAQSMYMEKAIAERELKKNFEEEERWSKKFTYEERKLCNMPHPRTDGIKNDLTYDQIISRGVIEESFDANGVGYRIYDKLYCSYWAMVVTPRLNYKGKSGGFAAVAYREDIKELRTAIESLAATERDLYCKTYNITTSSSKISSNKQNNGFNNQNKGKAANIDHVKKAMGMTKDNNDFNDEIF